MPDLEADRVFRQCQGCRMPADRREQIKIIITSETCPDFAAFIVTDPFMDNRLRPDIPGLCGVVLIQFQIQVPDKVIIIAESCVPCFGIPGILVLGDTAAVNKISPETVLNHNSSWARRVGFGWIIPGGSFIGTSVIA